MIWHNATAAEVEMELKTNRVTGLTSAEAAQRKQQYGENSLKKKKKVSLLHRFFSQLKDFMVIILMVAAVVSCAVTLLTGDNHWVEPIAIVVIIIVNALLGVVQESKAEKALEALRGMIAPSAKVVRDGEVQVIRASDLVPGDVILLEAGDLSRPTPDCARRPPSAVKRRRSPANRCRARSWPMRFSMTLLGLATAPTWSIRVARSPTGAPGLL